MSIAAHAARPVHHVRSPLIVIAPSRPSRSLAPNGHPLPTLLNPKLTAAARTPSPRASSDWFR
jgi:hypothetical protein